MNSYRVAKSSCVTASNTALTKIFSVTRRDQIVAVICICNSQSFTQELIMKMFSLIQQYFFGEDTCMFLQCAYIKRSVLPLAEK